MQKVYTKIESIVGNVVTVRAKDVRLGDLALVGDSYATVIKLDKDLVSLQVFAGAQGVGTSVHSTVGSEAVWINITVWLMAPPFSRVSRNAR